MYAMTMSNIDDIDSGEKPYTAYRETKREMDTLVTLWLAERTMTFYIPGMDEVTFTLVGYRDGVQEFAMVEMYA